MNKVVHSSHKTTNYQLQTTNCRQRRLGFTLIELLLVISILTITFMIVTASFSGFEKREKVKNAALEIKNQIRATQNKALSGDKGFGANLCLETSQLVGWYVTVDESSNTLFKITGDCSDGVTETNFSPKTVNLSKDVRILDVKYGSDSTPTKANILFRPQDNEAKFFNASNTPPFLTGQVINQTKLLGSIPQGPMTITLEIVGSSTKYEVVILSSGSVYEKKL